MLSYLDRLLLNWYLFAATLQWRNATWWLHEAFEDESILLLYFESTLFKAISGLTVFNETRQNQKSIFTLFWGTYHLNPWFSPFMTCHLISLHRGGTPYICAAPKCRVFAPFRLKTGIDLPILVCNRVWFSREVWLYLSFQFQMNRK